MHTVLAKKLILGLVAALLLCPCTTSALPLLQGFEYGAAKSEIAGREGAVLGKESFQNDVFFKGVPWAGFAWTAQCHFTENGLNGVTLYSAYSRELLKQVSTHLKEHNFQLLGMIIDDKALDMITLVKLGGPEAFQKRFRELTRAKIPQQISYEWFDGNKIPQDQLKDTASLGQLLTLVPRDTMQIDVTQSAKGEKLENSILLIHFSYPVIDELKRREGIQP